MPCCIYSSCIACSCSVAGSLLSQCDKSGKCTCKQNVEGNKCDQCKSGTVNLQQKNKYGCSGGTLIFRTVRCWGIRNSESSPMLFEGSEILNPLLCCSGGQKFWLLSFVVWGIRHSESSPSLFGGSEILNPLLCCLGDPKFWILSFLVWGIRNSDSSPLLFGGRKFWILSFVVWGIRNSESSPVLFGGSEILTPLLCALGN